MRNGFAKLSKRAWYRKGGFRNSRLFRRGTGRAWSYWELIS